VILHPHKLLRGMALQQLVMAHALKRRKWWSDRAWWEMAVSMTTTAALAGS
jgi:hypothetical protein